MLILTRRVSEAIIVGEGDNKAVITIIGTNRSQVKLEIDAAKSIPVFREEIYKKINNETTTIDKKSNIISSNQETISHEHNKHHSNKGECQDEKSR